VLQQAAVDGAAAVQTALADAGAVLAGWLGAGDGLLGGGPMWPSAQIAIVTAGAAVVCIGLVIRFQGRHAEEI
jgi:hypothetical protein